MTAAFGSDEAPNPRPLLMLSIISERQWTRIWRARERERLVWRQIIEPSQMKRTFQGSIMQVLSLLWRNLQPTPDSKGQLSTCRIAFQKHNSSASSLFLLVSHFVLLRFLAPAYLTVCVTNCHLLHLYRRRLLSTVDNVALHKAVCLVFGSRCICRPSRCYCHRHRWHQKYTSLSPPPTVC
jgi:hypothetical protein